MSYLPPTVVLFTAAGTNQGNALPLPGYVSVANSVAAGSGVILTALATQRVFNRGGNDLLVYPPVGGQIEGYGTNTPYTLTLGEDAIFTMASPTQFYLSLTLNGFTRRVLYTASGTWTVPVGVVQCYVYVWGGGGGSGACYASGSASLGGGAGGYAEGLVVGLTAGSVVTVTIGAGGSAGAYSSSPTAGGSGGTSSFGSSISATGGTGGSAASGGTATGVSNGGSGVGGDLQISGGECWGPFAITSGSIVVTSAGGAAFGGSMAHSGSTSVTANGIAGHFPGGGAAGSAAAASGAVGGSGLIKIIY